MAETKTIQDKKRKLPAWAGWLIGWGVVLLAAALLVYYWRVIFFIDPSPGLPALPATLGAMGVFSLLYLAVFCITRLKEHQLALKAALLVFLLGLLFCFSTAPLQAPDESQHYLRAVSLSMGHFTYNGAEVYPDDVSLLVQQFAGGALNHEARYAAGQLVPANLAAYHTAVAAGQAVQNAGAPIMFMLLPFLPQALFMAVARLFGGGALALMYAGRLANLAVYAVICYFTFRQCHKYRGVFFAFTMLPLSLFMAASCSYDSLMLAGCFYLLSFFCKREIHTRDLVLFCAVLAFCTYIKPMNFVLAALLLLIPKTRWKSRWNPWLVTGVLVAAALLFWYGAGLIDGTVLKHDYGELPRGAGDEANPGGQLEFILGNPLAFLPRLMQSVLESELFLFDLGRLGSMDLVLPLVGGFSVLSLCVASALGIQQKEDTRTGAAVGLGLMALLYTGAIIIGMYVLQSDLYAIRVDGLQPRYFLPVFLLLFMLGSILLGRAVRPRLSGPATAIRTETVTLWVAVGVALLAAVLLFQSYFIGQWFQGADGSWKLVNLFGHIKVN